MARATPAAAMAALVLLCGCTSWAATELAPLAPVGKHVQVWHGGRVIELHQTVTTLDSLVGEHHLMGRMGVARPDVDSVRVRRVDVGKTFLTVFGIVPASLAMLFLLDPPEEI